MLYLLCLGILATSVWSIARTIQAIRRRPTRVGWWLAFTIFAAAGAGFALWSLSSVTHSWQISSNIKFLGIPIPAEISTWEEGGWTNSGYSTPVACVIALVDILACAAFALIPLMLLVRMGKKSKRPESQAPL